MKKIGLLFLGLCLGIALVLTAFYTAGNRWTGWLLRGVDPETIAAASLESVREQQKLTVFAARFVAVVTSEHSRYGLSAKKTMILPGLVRYHVDLARLESKDLKWDAATSTLMVHMPPVVVTGPEILLSEMREYDSGGFLMAFTNAEKQLDNANRKAATDALLGQARESVPMRLASDAAARAVERSFIMPLKAAGIDAKVTTTFEKQDK